MGLGTGEKVNTDKDVSLGCTVAYGMWGMAGLMFVGVMVTGDVRMCGGLFLTIGVATTATVRTYFVAFSSMVRRAFDGELDPTASGYRNQ